jgi:hypothetical protein
MTGVDPAPLYTERLHAPAWLWLLAGLMATSLGIAYAVPVSTAAGVAVGGAAFAVAGALLLRAAALIEVTPTVLRAGPASIPVGLLGAPIPLDRDAAARRRGVAADPAAWMLLRGWIPTAVEVAVVDPADDTPYWFVSTRHPDRLCAALRAARDDQGSPSMH